MTEQRLHFDPNTGKPEHIYRKLAEHITELIRDGELPAGERFYSQTDLAWDFFVSPATARLTTGLLAERGLIVRDPTGRYVVASGKQP
jgi:DNA-binding GntR family transcriptional regulator